MLLLLLAAADAAEAAATAAATTTLVMVVAVAATAAAAVGHTSTSERLPGSDSADAQSHGDERHRTPDQDRDPPRIVRA